MIRGTDYIEREREREREREGGGYSDKKPSLMHTNIE